MLDRHVRVRGRAGHADHRGGDPVPGAGGGRGQHLHPGADQPARAPPPGRDGRATHWEDVSLCCLLQLIKTALGLVLEGIKSNKNTFPKLIFIDMGTPSGGGGAGKADEEGGPCLEFSQMSPLT